jgi:2-methylisocitrate lyase-like PEP mutase family enzyme
VTWLAERLAQPEPLIAPGAYDALSAKVIASRGFEVVYVGGYSVAASAFGVPDIGMVSGSELLDAYRRIRSATDAPLIVDADNGYGGPVSVARTVRELKRIGVVALHIEDQVTPKRCGHMEDKRVVPIDESAARIRAAVGAAGADGPAIIARSDALQPEGLESVVERGRAYEAAGAAAFFVDAPGSLEELRGIRDAVSIPLVFNAASTGKTPPLTVTEVSELGYSLIIYPNQPLYAAFAAAEAWLDGVPGDGVINTADGLPGFDRFNDFLGLSAYAEWERQVSAGRDASIETLSI